MRSPKIEDFNRAIPSATLEDLFLRIVEESKARPGRRYLPPSPTQKEAV